MLMGRARPAKKLRPSPTACPSSTNGSSVNLMFDRMERFARAWDRFAYVVDLTEAKRPDPETRAVLKARVVRLLPRITHVAVAVGDNLLMRAMARLFAYGMGLPSVGIYATRAEAIEEARRVMGR